MVNARKNYSNAENIALLSQVNKICPLCSESLFYTKNKRTYKNYEIAHIYPLNPTDEEIRLLSKEEILGDHVNDEDNVIPLCSGCHGKLDNPRTVEEYRKLKTIKQKLIDQSKEEAIWKHYQIESEIDEIIKAIYEDPAFDTNTKIDFKSKTVDEKLDESISRPTKIKIKGNVQEYYLFIRDKFSSLDQVNSDLSELISLQIKTYYLKQKHLGHDQQVIFDNIVSWINEKTKPKTHDAAEILASFFVQNCEVF